MACDTLIWGLLFIGCSIQALWAISEDDPSDYMTKEEKESLKFVLFIRLSILWIMLFIIILLYFREEARDMFYHAYNAYMVSNI